MLTVDLPFIDATWKHILPVICKATLRSADTNSIPQGLFSLQILWVNIQWYDTFYKAKWESS